MGFGFGRFATSATRCLPLFSTTVGSPLYCYSGGPGVGPLAQIVRRAIDGRRAYDANNFGKPSPGDCGLPDIYVSETKCSSCLQHWKADNCPNKPRPKPDDIFVYFLSPSGNAREYFVAYDNNSLEEDGLISPKYRIYAPSFPGKGYSFTGCTCDGLLHFHDNKSGHVLWNPTTSEYKILPEPFLGLTPGTGYSCQANGMWSDPRFEDYKLLHLMKTWVKDEQGMFHDQCHHIHLYSLKTNSWRRIPCTEFNCIQGNTCTCISGVFYVAAFQKETCRDVILSFDFSTETLSSLPLPNQNCNPLLLTEYKGLLSALEFWFDEDDSFGDDESCDCELWIMSDGSWTKESIFHTRGIHASHFSPDGELLYFVSSVPDLELVVFDRAIGKLKQFGVNRSVGYPIMIPFVESFVQLNGISCVQERHEHEKEEKKQMKT